MVVDVVLLVAQAEPVAPDMAALQAVEPDDLLLERSLTRLSAKVSKPPYLAGIPTVPIMDIFFIIMYHYLLIEYDALQPCPINNHF